MARARDKNPRPVVGRVPAATKVVATGAIPQARQWNFSFRFFREIDLFGTGHQDAGWFVSVLERLAELCTKQVSDVLSSPAEKLHWRLHEIDWAHKGIPISRNDLNWIDKKYLENGAEFPFWQFSVSKALGRIVGFWDEKGIFNLVLLDPSHNIQPSKYSEYKTREAPIAKGEFEIAIAKIEEVISVCGEGCGCRKIYSEIQAGLTYRLAFSTVLVSMPDELFKRVGKIFESGAVSCISDLLEIAVGSLEAPIPTASE